jgi:hypothetical protein
VPTSQRLFSRSRLFIRCSRRLILRLRRLALHLRPSFSSGTIPRPSILHPRRRTEPTSPAHRRTGWPHTLWSHSLRVTFLWSALHSIATSASAHRRWAVHPTAHRTKSAATEGRRRRAHGLPFAIILLPHSIAHRSHWRTKSAPAGPSHRPMKHRPPAIALAQLPIEFLPHHLAHHLADLLAQARRNGHLIQSIRATAHPASWRRHLSAKLPAAAAPSATGGRRRLLVLTVGLTRRGLVGRELIGWSLIGRSPQPRRRRWVITAGAGSFLSAR